MHPDVIGVHDVGVHDERVAGCFTTPTAVVCRRGRRTAEVSVRFVLD